jgi:hypothetical protein
MRGVPAPRHFFSPHSPDCVEGGGSRKSGPEMPGEARAARAGRTARNSTHPIRLLMNAPRPTAMPPKAP